MARLCDITRKRIPHPSNIEDNSPLLAAKNARYYLKRTLKVPEASGKINLWVSEEGMELVKKAGGLSSFLKDREDNKLIPKLLKLKRQIHGEPKPEQVEEASEEAPKEEAKAQE
ncbi:MAG: hypothetical protein KDK66_07595 [Deltaproteobacteria bacterium]|nr:hypothetical protein [Deltaproteobacteria bacterium]